MESNDSEKTALQDNLIQAVKDCPLLKVGSRKLESSSFRIMPQLFLDFTEDKYEDGIHSYRMGASIKVINNDGDYIEEQCDIHFDAQIVGTDVDILNGLVIAERNIIPLNYLS